MPPERLRDPSPPPSPPPQPLEPPPPDQRVDPAPDPVMQALGLLTTQITALTQEVAADRRARREEVVVPPRQPDQPRVRALEPLDDDDVTLKKFKIWDPPIFDGTSGASRAEQWLKDILLNTVH